MEAGKVRSLIPTELGQLKIELRKVIGLFLELKLCTAQQLTEVAEQGNLRPANEQKAMIAERLYQAIQDGRVEARAIDILCSDHPIRPLAKKYRLEGAEAQLYQTLEGISGRFRERSLRFAQDLAARLDGTQLDDEFQALIDEARAEKMLIRNPQTGTLNHNRNFLGAKMIFEAYIEAQRRIRPVRAA